MNAVVRSFSDKPAVREATPLLLGLIGPSGTGKTFSALRLATGIQRVVGGDIYGIDTESRRMLHYAERFRFRHLQFDAPFGPLDYLAAIEHCIRKGAKTIIVDSMSHEHEGPGGVLEQHANETKRLAALWKCSEEKAQMSAWSGPKQDRRRMINSILQMNANFLFCFRSKEKLKLGGGKPQEMGFMPIAGEEFVYEMVAKCLLLPGANGVPTWKSDYPGEKMMMKIPEQFKDLFGVPRQLDEDMGAQLAQWAAGAASQQAIDINPYLASYAACRDRVEFEKLETQRRDMWASLSKSAKEQLKLASDAVDARLAVPIDADKPPMTTTESVVTFAADLAIAQLNACKDVNELDDTWKRITANAKEFGHEIPVNVEAVRNDKREALQGV